MDEEEKTEQAETEVVGYCVRCKNKRPFKTFEVKKVKKAMLKGECSVCGTKMCRLLSNADYDFFKEQEGKPSSPAFFMEGKDGN